MVSSDCVFMDLHSFRSEGDVGGPGAGPATGVEVGDAVALHLKSAVRVAAENEIGALGFGVAQGALGNFGREPQPGAVEAIEPAAEMLAAGIEPLQKQVDRRAEIAHERIVDHEAVELVSVDGKAAASVKIPGVLLIHAHAHQVRHDVREALIVIAFDPNNFDSALGIGEFPDVGEKPPMVFFEATEVEIAKDVAEQNQTPEGIGLQHAHSVAGAAELRPEMQIGEDDGVYGLAVHLAPWALDLFALIRQSFAGFR